MSFCTLLKQPKRPAGAFHWTTSAFSTLLPQSTDLDVDHAVGMLRLPRIFIVRCTCSIKQPRRSPKFRGFVFGKGNGNDRRQAMLNCSIRPSFTVHVDQSTGACRTVGQALVLLTQYGSIEFQSVYSNCSVAWDW